MESIGENLKSYRRKRRLSQMQLSKLSGVSRSHISEIESDKYKNITIDVLCKLCRALYLTPNDLIPAEKYK